MEIKEVGEKISSSFKNGKGLWIVGGVFVGLFVISLISQSGNDDGGTTENISLQGAYASYPDAVTNANVIIDSLQQSIDFQTEEMNENFKATNDYINEGLNAMAELEKINHGETMETLDNLSDKIDRNTGTILATTSAIGNGLSNLISTSKSELSSQISDSTGKILASNQSLSERISYTQDSLNALKTSTNSQANNILSMIEKTNDAIKKSQQEQKDIQNQIKIANKSSSLIDNTVASVGYDPSAGLI